MEHRDASASYNWSYLQDLDGNANLEELDKEEQERADNRVREIIRVRWIFIRNWRREEKGSAKKEEEQGGKEEGMGKIGRGKEEEM